MKKTISLILAIILCMALTVPSFAVNVNQAYSADAALRADAITTIDQVKKAAVQVPLIDENGNSVYKLVDEQAGIVTERYVLEEVVDKKVSLMSSEVVEEKATTVFEHVYSARASDSNTRTGYDNSGGILFRTTVSYTSEYYNGRTYYDMRQIDGGYTRYDTTINVVSQRLDYGQNGFIKSGGTITQAKNNVSISSSNLTVVPPSSWVEVSPEGGLKVGCVLTHQCNRNQTPWTGELLNHI